MPGELVDFPDVMAKKDVAELVTYVAVGASRVVIAGVVDGDGPAVGKVEGGGGERSRLELLQFPEAGVVYEMVSRDDFDVQVLGELPDVDQVVGRRPMSARVRSASRSASALNPRRTSLFAVRAGFTAAGQVVLHVFEELAEQPGCFGLESRSGAQPDPGLLRRAGETGVKLADQPGDMAGGLVGKVGVAAEMMGDDLRGVLGSGALKLRPRLASSGRRIRVQGHKADV